MPFVYLSTMVFGELLMMSQEEFGFASSEGGRITLPCDATVIEYVLCLVRRDASEEVERAFLSSIVGHCHGQDALMGPTINLLFTRSLASENLEFFWSDLKKLYSLI